MPLDAIVHKSPPEAPRPKPVRFPDLRGEWRIGREALRLAFSARRLFQADRGHDEPVLLIPGWQAPEASMAPLRRLLLRKGYDARHWGLGVNRGQVERYLDILVPNVEALARERAGRVGLVGWSLGGVIAREIAREVPAAVSCVITYGSPVVGGPTYSVAASSYGRDECERISGISRQRAKDQPISVPMSVIFSRGDTIVSWPACIDRFSTRAVHYEVTSTHLSMGIDPSVWQVVLETLGQHAAD